jgi:hypothetical protein
MSFSGRPSPVPAPPASGTLVVGPSCSSTSRRSTARTISTYSRVLRSGFPHACPCQPSTTCGPDVPRPSRKRPPESKSSVAAVIAVFAGERPGICMIAEPTLSVVVVAASHASTVTASVPHASAAHAES